MPAFNHAILSTLQSNIRGLFYRREKLGKLALTYEEYIQTFVPTEARQLFRDITPYIAGSLLARMDIGPEGHQARIRAADNSKALMNRHVIQPDAPADVVERIDTWRADSGDPSRDFGRVLRVLLDLNASCSKTAMRYYWPTIIAICSESEATKPIALELQELKKPASPPPLPHGLLQACKQTAETIATARLLPADAPPPPLADVSIEIVHGQMYRDESIGFFYGLT